MLPRYRCYVQQVDHDLQPGAGYTIFARHDFERLDLKGLMVRGYDAHGNEALSVEIGKDTEFVLIFDRQKQTATPWPVKAYP